MLTFLHKRTEKHSAHSVLEKLVSPFFRDRIIWKQSHRNCPVYFALRAGKFLTHWHFPVSLNQAFVSFFSLFSPVLLFLFSICLLQWKMCLEVKEEYSWVRVSVAHMELLLWWPDQTGTLLWLWERPDSQDYNSIKTHSMQTSEVCRESTDLGFFQQNIGLLLPKTHLVEW